MSSKALYLLWIVYTTLPYYLLAGTVKPDHPDVLVFKRLYTFPEDNASDVLLRKMDLGGMEFKHPDDPNKVVRVYKFPTQEDGSFIFNEQAALDKLTTKAEELGAQIPFVQKLYREFDFPFGGGGNGVGITLELERFRGSLLDGLFGDTALKVSLEDFGMRLEMYKQIAFAFQQMSALGMKNCNIELPLVLYKKTGDDFTTTPPPETDTAFTFVLNDFKFARDLGSPCDAGMPSTWDHDDSQGSIPKSGKCKGKIEIFGLGMLILKIETLALTMGQGGLEIIDSRPQNISEALQTMPDAPEDIFEFFNEKEAILHKTSYDILDEIINWLQFYNTGDEDVDNPVRVIDEKTLLTSLAYVEMANALTFEQKDLERHSALADNAGVKDKVVANYAAFNKLLQSMVKPNDYVNGRPDAAETNTALIKIQQAYVANIQSLARDRILLV